MAELELTLHPDKTWVGRTERGFDFLGYRLGGARVEGEAMGSYLKLL